MDLLTVRRVVTRPNHGGFYCHGTTTYTTTARATRTRAASRAVRRTVPRTAIAWSIPTAGPCTSTARARMLGALATLAGVALAAAIFYLGAVER